ncbi:MAG: transposase [Mariprofundaceae bacterium]|nr:transposase [Mariprofundaceae bacterium]MBN4061529.1 transposase [bacterium AH-315-G11]
MPRKPRFYVAGMPVHVVQRGNNRQAIFFDDVDYCTYLKWLYEAAGKYGCVIHAYVLMTNHVHILVTPKDVDGISRMMQYLGRRYVPYINHTYQRSGTLWEGRYKSSLIDADEYLLACYRYIEMNPVRASMVKHPSDYAWSSYACNAEGKADKLIRPHALYIALGNSERSRKEAYQALFQAGADDNEMINIRVSWQTGTPLGNDRFKEEIEAVLGKKVGHNKRGRPLKYDK